jgi:hypothetical protein
MLFLPVAQKNNMLNLWHICDSSSRQRSSSPEYATHSSSCNWHQILSTYQTTRPHTQSSNVAHVTRNTGTRAQQPTVPAVTLPAALAFTSLQHLLQAHVLRCRQHIKTLRPKPISRPFQQAEDDRLCRPVLRVVWYKSCAF